VRRLSSATNRHIKISWMAKLKIWMVYITWAGMIFTLRWCIPPVWSSENVVPLELLRQSRVAAVAGEVAKDLKPQDVVEEAGCNFVPLVVETFGVWSPFTLKVLRKIADRTSARNGVSTKQARKNSAVCFFKDKQCLYDFTILGFAGLRLWLPCP